MDRLYGRASCSRAAAAPQVWRTLENAITLRQQVCKTSIRTETNWTSLELDLMIQRCLRASHWEQHSPRTFMSSPSLLAFRMSLPPNTCFTSQCVIGSMTKAGMRIVMLPDSRHRSLHRITFDYHELVVATGSATSSALLTTALHQNPSA